MSTVASISIPAAILLGCGMISAALFFGLRARAPEMATTVPAPTSAPVTAMPAPVAITPRETVAAQAQEAVLYQLEGLRARCPAGAGERYRFTFDVTFDAHGVEVLHGITEDRSNPATGMGLCVSGALAPLRVPPPGVMTMVEVSLSLP